MSSNEETVYVFEHEGRTFEVDHCTLNGDVGTYAVYEDDRQISDFGVCDARFDHPVPVACEPGDELRAYAIQSLQSVGALS